LLSQVLVNNVLNDWKDYRLSSEVIRRFRLAEENYSFPLFIHPPVFVYSAAFMFKYLHLPLPFISVMYQLGTLLLLPWMASAINNGDSQLGQMASLWSMVVFSFCPIAMLMSQKFWIDNCLMFTVTLCGVVHLTVNKFYLDGKGLGRSLLLQLLSGLIFALFGVQSKITALGLLPFLLLDTARTRLAAHRTGSSTMLIKILDVSAHSIMLLSGSAAGYSPWMYLYYVSSRIMFLKC
jgi:hypothetical protein